MRLAMQRMAFQLRVKPGSEEAYDEAHRSVWPELIEELQAFGVREYSIFRRGCELFLYMLVPDFQALLDHLAQSDVDRRWQETMAPLFEKVPTLKEGETFAMMDEVFYMQGKPLG
jgi:L-rhamnose mutarotase